MQIVDLALRLVGGFYLFAGLLGLQAMALDALMDKVLFGLTLEPTPSREDFRRFMLAGGSYLVGLSGAALMVLSLWAVPLFILATGLQASWLIWAKTNYPAETPLEAKGRRQSTNAAVLYAIVAATVGWSALAGVLRPWSDLWALFLPIAGIGFVVFAARHLFWSAAQTPTSGSLEHNDYEEEEWHGPPVPPPKRLRLEPTWGGHDVLDVDTGKPFPYYDYLPQDLGYRIHMWTQAFRANEDHTDQVLWAEFESRDDETAHRAEGDALVAELIIIFGAGNVDGPVYPSDVRYVGPVEALSAVHLVTAGPCHGSRSNLRA